MAEAIPYEPVPDCDPVFWSYADDIRPALLEAGELISAEEAERRVLILNNPRLPRGTTKTLVGAIQMIKGGEIAPAHRHTQSALRFVIEGVGRQHGGERREDLHASRRSDPDAGLDLARPCEGNRGSDDLVRRARYPAGQSSGRNVLGGVRRAALSRNAAGGRLRCPLWLGPPANRAGCGDAPFSASQLSVRSHSGSA
jgi:hypothetical protein